MRGSSELRKGSQPPFWRALDNFSSGYVATISLLLLIGYPRHLGSLWEDPSHYQLSGRTLWFGEGILPPLPDTLLLLPAGQRCSLPSVAHCSSALLPQWEVGAEPGPPGQEHKAAPPLPGLQRPRETNFCHCGGLSSGSGEGDSWGKQHSATPWERVEQARR